QELARSQTPAIRRATFETLGQRALSSAPMHNCPKHVCCTLCSGAIRTRFMLNGYTIVQCAACGFMFVQEILSDAELRAQYEAGEGDPTYEDPENVANLGFYYRKLKAEIERLVPSGRILDVGCGSGQFLDLMEGWDRYGIEIGRAAAAAK